MAARRGNMRFRSSGIKSKKKKSENEDEAGKSGNGTEKCEEKLVNDLEKAERIADEEESGQGEGDELRDEESVESQESVGPFIRPGNRRFR